MGQAFTRRLRACGYPVTGYDIAAEKVEAAARHGVQPAASAAEVDASERHRPGLRDDRGTISSSAVFGDRGVAAAASAGKILIDHSTTEVETTKAFAARLAETGMGWIDAPVSGGPPAAEAGTLAIMAGGDEAHLARVRALLADLGQCTHMGPVGAGQVTKMVNQVLVLANYCVLAEALALAEAGGVDAARIPEALGAGYAGSTMLQRLYPRMVARDFAPAGYAFQALKDLDMVQGLAKSLTVPTPMTARRRPCSASSTPRATAGSTASRCSSCSTRSRSERTRPMRGRAMRKIIHVDMDAFYASVEQRDRPELRGLPVAVGGGGARGVVMAASYEARAFGVRSAMPGFQARRLCPELVFVPTRFDAYEAASRQIRDIFESYTDLVEPLSLDEAYLDVSAPKRGGPIATEIARAIKQEIRATTGLTASAGVSFNKFLAKIASDLEKPDGLTVIRPEQAEAFIAGLPIERFFGVGPATARKMKALGIHDGARASRALRGRARPPLRQGRAPLLPDRARPRRARGAARPAAQVDRRRAHLRSRPRRSGRHARAPRADRRAGRRAHGARRPFRPHRDPQDQAPRFLRDHPAAHPARPGGFRRGPAGAGALAAASPRAAAPAGALAGPVGLELRPGPPALAAHLRIGAAPRRTFRSRLLGCSWDLSNPTAWKSRPWRSNPGKKLRLVPPPRSPRARAGSSDPRRASRRPVRCHRCRGR